MGDEQSQTSSSDKKGNLRQEIISGVGSRRVHPKSYISAPAPWSEMMVLSSEVDVMEQILIRNLPAGTKAAIRVLAERHGRSVEAEVHAIIAAALEHEPISINDMLSMDEGAEIEFELPPLHLAAREPEL